MLYRTINSLAQGPEMIRKVARHIIGWFLLALGIVGLFLPILQGVLFIIIAMIMLAPDVPLFHKWLVRLEERHPVPFEKARNCYAALLSKLKIKGAVSHGCKKIENPVEPRNE